jgi:hypothetical protein
MTEPAGTGQALSDDVGVQETAGKQDAGDGAKGGGADSGTLHGTSR